MRHRDVASTLTRRWSLCTHWVFTDVLIDMQVFYIVSHNSFKNCSVYVQLTLVISTSLISNNRLSRSENLVPSYT